MHRIAIASLLLAALVPAAAAHHTADCGTPLAGTSPGVQVYADGCLGARVTTPGPCAEVIHPLGHNGCEYVLAAPLPTDGAGFVPCDMIPVVREDLRVARVLLAAGPGCYEADVALPVLACFPIPQLHVETPGGGVVVDVACHANAHGDLPLVPRSTCTPLASANLDTPATRGDAAVGALCADAWAGQAVFPCPLVPTLFVPIPGGRLWIWPMCAAGVEWAAPVP